MPALFSGGHGGRPTTPASSSTIARAIVSAVPMNSRTRVLFLSARLAAGRISSHASKRAVAASSRSSASTSPRARSSFSAPVRFSATRWHSPALSTESECTWIERTRTSLPDGSTRSLSADAHLGAHRSAGDDDAVSLDDERAIERQPEDAGGAARLEAVELTDDLVAQFVEAHASDRRDLDDRRAGERGAVGQQFDFVAHVADARGVGEVGLGDHEDAAAGAEQMQDVEMLLGLRHHAVVGRHGEQHEIDAVGAGEHVADEALVAGDVDDAGAGAVGQCEVGEAEIDRNPALLFLLEAVGVLPGERLDQRGLAVIDMSGGADDGVSGGRSHRGADVILLGA